MTATVAVDAQTEIHRLTGVVRDTSQEIIIGVKISLPNHKSTVTNFEGKYQIDLSTNPYSDLPLLRFGYGL